MRERVWNIDNAKHYITNSGKIFILPMLQRRCNAAPTQQFQFYVYRGAADDKVDA